NRNRAALHQRAQRFAVDEFADHVIDAVDRAEIENGNDVRMVQGRDRLGLNRKAGTAICLARKILAKDLHRDFAAQARVASTIDFAHSAGAQRREYLVRPQTAVDAKIHEHLSTSRACPIPIRDAERRRSFDTELDVWMRCSVSRRLGFSPDTGRPPLSSCRGACASSSQPLVRWATCILIWRSLSR